MGKDNSNYSGNACLRFLLIWLRNESRDSNAFQSSGKFGFTQVIESFQKWWFCTALLRQVWKNSSKNIHSSLVSDQITSHIVLNLLQSWLSKSRIRVPQRFWAFTFTRLRHDNTTRRRDKAVSESNSNDIQSPKFQYERIIDLDERWAIILSGNHSLFSIVSRSS